MQHPRFLNISNSAWLLTLLLVALSAAAPTQVDDRWSCAPGCWCSEDALSAECDGATPDPATLPQGLLALSLRAHQLRDVSNQTFSAQPALQQLDLSNGRISEVTADAFSPLPLLRSLSLSNNELTYLPSDVVSTNPALEALDLSSNPLVLPSIGPFLRSPSLRELGLASCMLRRFTPDTFAQLPSLVSLDLSSNAFSQLTSEAVQPFANLSWLGMDANALTADALTFLRDKGVEVEVQDSENTTMEELPEDQGDVGVAIYLGFVDKEYHYEEDTFVEDYGVLKPNQDVYDPDVQWLLDGQPQTGDTVMEWRHPSWKLVLYLVVMVSTTCVALALAYWATVLVLRRRSMVRAARGPRETLDRAFRQVASVSAHQQLQKQAAKGYRRLYDEDDAPQLLPPRSESCSCLSCSEPVPTQPCIRFYEGPTSVHGAVPGRYYQL